MDTQPLASIDVDIGKEVFHIVGFSLTAALRSMRAYFHQGHGPRADQTGRYISATSATHALSLLRNAAGPYNHIADLTTQ